MDYVCKFAECLEKDVIAESEDGSQVQEVLCGTSSNISNVQHVIKASDRVLEGESELSTEKHSISVEVRC